MKRTCRDCTFWNGGRRIDDGVDGPSECRHSPPLLRVDLGVDLDEARRGFWPMTEPDEWCGKFDHHSPPPDFTLP